MQDIIQRRGGGGGWGAGDVLCCCWFVLFCHWCWLYVGRHMGALAGDSAANRSYFGIILSYSFPLRTIFTHFLSLVCFFAFILFLVYLFVCAYLHTWIILSYSFPLHTIFTHYLSQQDLWPKRTNKLAKARKTRTLPGTLDLKKFGLGKLWVKKVFMSKKFFGSKKFFEKVEGKLRKLRKNWESWGKTEKVEEKKPEKV